VLLFIEGAISNPSIANLRGKSILCLFRGTVTPLAYTGDAVAKQINKRVK
jgi:hypothetical protein